jgi:hypothetical protein
VAVTACFEEASSGAATTGGGGGGGVVHMAIVTAAGCVYRVPVRTESARKRRRGSGGATAAREEPAMEQENDDDGDEVVEAPQFGPTADAVVCRLDDEPSHGMLDRPPSLGCTAAAALPSGDVLVVTLCANERWMATFAHSRRVDGSSAAAGDARSASVVVDVIRDQDIDGSRGLTGRAHGPPPHVSVVLRAGDGSGAGGRSFIDAALHTQVFGASATSVQCLVALPTGRVFSLEPPQSPGWPPRVRLVMSVDGPVCSVLALAGDAARVRAPTGASSAMTSASRASDAPRGARVCSALAVVLQSGLVQTVHAGHNGTPVVTEHRVEGPLNSAVTLDGSTVVFLRADGIVSVSTLPCVAASAGAASAATTATAASASPTVPTARVEGLVASWLAAVSSHAVAVGLQQSGDMAVCDAADLAALSAAVGRPQSLARDDDRERRGVESLRADVIALALEKKCVERERAAVERAIADVNVALHLQEASSGGACEVTCRVHAVVPTAALRAKHPLAVLVAIGGLPNATYLSGRWSIVVSSTCTRHNRGASTLSLTIPLPPVPPPGGGLLHLECPIDDDILPATVRVMLTCDVGGPTASSHQRGSSSAPQPTRTFTRRSSSPSDHVVVLVIARQQLDVLDFLMHARALQPFDSPVCASELPEAVAAAVNRRGHSSGSGGFHVSDDTTGAHSGLHRAHVPLPRAAVDSIYSDGVGKDAVLARVLAAVGCERWLGEATSDGSGALLVTARTTNGVLVQIRAAHDEALQGGVVLSVAAGNSANCHDLCAAVTDRMWRHTSLPTDPRSGGVAGLGAGNSGGGGGVVGGPGGAAAAAIGMGSATRVPLDRLMLLEQAATHAYVVPQTRESAFAR